jgi:hypothetical protein
MIYGYSSYLNEQKIFLMSSLQKKVERDRQKNIGFE